MFIKHLNQIKDDNSIKEFKTYFERLSLINKELIKKFKKGSEEYDKIRECINISHYLIKKLNIKDDSNIIDLTSEEEQEFIEDEIKETDEFENLYVDDPVCEKDLKEGDKITFIKGEHKGREGMIDKLYMNGKCTIRFNNNKRIRNQSSSNFELMKKYE